MILTFNYVYVLVPKLRVVEVKHEFASKPRKVLLFDLQITLVLLSDSLSSVD